MNGRICHDSLTWITDSGRQIYLTRAEYHLIFCLRMRAGVALSLDEIQRAAGLSSPRTVQTQVWSLRRKLGRGVIVTRHGFGYSVLPETAAQDAPRCVGASRGSRHTAREGIANPPPSSDSRNACPVNHVPDDGGAE